MLGQLTAVPMLGRQLADAAADAAAGRADGCGLPVHRPGPEAKMMSSALR